MEVDGWGMRKYKQKHHLINKIFPKVGHSEALLQLYVHNITRALWRAKRSQILYQPAQKARQLGEASLGFWLRAFGFVL